MLFCTYAFVMKKCLEKPQSLFLIVETIDYEFLLVIGIARKDKVAGGV